MFKKVSLLALLLVLALAACGGSPAADSAGQPGGVSAQLTATPVPTATPDSMGFAAPVGNGGYDNCPTPWDWGRIVEAYEKGGKYYGTILVERATKEAGPHDAHSCWQDRRGRWIFAQYDIEITKEAYERLNGISQAAVLAPAYWGVGMSSEWADAEWAHDYINGLTAEEVNELVNTYGPALLAVGTLAAVGLLSAAIIPPVIGAPLAPDCPANSCG